MRVFVRWETPDAVMRDVAIDQVRIHKVVRGVPVLTYQQTIETTDTTAGRDIVRALYPDAVFRDVQILEERAQLPDPTPQ